MVFGFRTFSGEKLYTMKKIYLNEKKKKALVLISLQGILL